MAKAPKAVWHPPPSRRLDRPGSRRIPRSVSPSNTPAYPPRSAVRHWMAIAPRPTAGTIASNPIGRISTPGHDAIRRRLSPAAASMVPSADALLGNFPQARVDVPAYLGKGDAGEHERSLAPAPRASRCEGFRCRDARAQDENVPGVLPGQVPRRGKSGDGVARQVLGAVDGQSPSPRSSAASSSRVNRRPLPPRFSSDHSAWRSPVVTSFRSSHSTPVRSRRNAGPRAPPGRAPAGSFGSQGRVCFPYPGAPSLRADGARSVRGLYALQVLLRHPGHQRRAAAGRSFQSCGRRPSWRKPSVVFLQPALVFGDPYWRVNLPETGSP